MDGKVDLAVPASRAQMTRRRHRRSGGGPAPARSGPGAEVVLDRISRVYSVAGGAIAGVADVSLTIPAGTFVSLTGPSGSGKSTLLNLIAGLDRPDSGSVTVDGTDLASLGEPVLAAFRRDTVGIVFQDAPLIAELTVEANVALPGLLAGLTRADAGDRARTLLGRVGLLDRVASAPSELSGGQRQRVALARALINSPALLVADEPTGNLDTRSGEQVIELIEDAHARGCTVLLVTHDARVAAVAQHQVRMLDGKLLGSRSVDG
jgi:putative ABC transport system ATP-binding protein